MKIQENLCPRCGKPSPDSAECPKCRVDKIRWMWCDSRIHVTECPTCGAQKDAGAWSNLERERAEVAAELVLRAIHLDPLAQNPEYDIRIDDISSNRSVASCTVIASVLGVPVDGSCTIEIVWQKEQCNRCSRLSGSYYEGIVQVRAKDRKPYLHEISLAAQIAQETEKKLQEGGERLSFITRMDERRDGLDIIVGSQRIGQEISSAIVQRLGGRVSTHPKLVGERAGRQVYRITYSLRLPKFIRGDIVVHQGQYGEVTHVEKDSVRYLDLYSGKMKSAKENTIERLVGNVRDAQSALIVFRDGDMTGVMDPDSGITIECQVPPISGLTEGMEVKILKDGQDIIILG
ncbi:MAG TPA: 60S ribosomal export protein NMD3 [Methanoregulaceae archaeon]|nr:60S ribosomal export protein NMD3 [Methanoregulaceae archaeon]